MDHFLLHSPLPWQFRAVIALFIPLVLSILLLHTPDKWLLKCREPTYITLALIPIGYLGFYLHLTHAFYWGFVLFALAVVGDVMDGKLAKLMEKLGIPRSPFMLSWGGILDPLGDKLRHLPPIWYYMTLAFIAPWLAWSIIAVDVLGTFLRKPFFKEVESDASLVGKIKTVFQALGLMTVMPYELNWYQDRWPTYLMLIPALLLGVLSVYLRFFEQPKPIQDFLARGSRLFRHEKISLRGLWTRSVAFLRRRDA